MTAPEPEQLSNAQWLLAAYSRAVADGRYCDAMALLGDAIAQVAELAGAKRTAERRKKRAG
jgi:hypothetical protein